MSARLWVALAAAIVLTAAVIVAAVVNGSAGLPAASRYPAAAPTDVEPSADPSSDASEEPAPGDGPSRTAAPEGLTADQRAKADVLISTFENSTTAVQYGYAENLGDGHGVTSGRAGFTTADGDALDVVRHYTGAEPGNPLARFLPDLTRLADEHSGDTRDLPERDYIAAWREAGDDPAFKQAQDDALDRLAYEPAMKRADRAGLRTPLARTEVYDALVQHGDGEDPDGLPALLGRAADRAGGTPADGVDEHRWLDAFFAVRLDDLRHPRDEGRRRTWPESTDRVRCVQRLAEAGNWDLSGSVRFSVYGDDFLVG